MAVSPVDVEVIRPFLDGLGHEALSHRAASEPDLKGDRLVGPVVAAYVAVA